METDFRDVIAEPPYDAMGAEFRETFGKWVNETKLTNPNELNQLAFGLFRLRLALAQKYGTFFAKQVTADGSKELWKERFAGQGNSPCYSFAAKNVARTTRFWKWAVEVYFNGNNPPTSVRHWDTTYAEHPSFPIQIIPWADMDVWSHRYEPRFTARTGGAFECRTILYGYDDNSAVFLFEHPRSRWIGQIRAEATTFWNIAFDSNNDQYTRFGALASFEWLWNWANPFMRSGALTSDALSLVMQKHIGAKTRTSFYHQDCEALLMPFDAYVEKRINDMTNGFVPRFDMNVA